MSRCLPAALVLVLAASPEAVASNRSPADATGTALQRLTASLDEMDREKIGKLCMSLHVPPKDPGRTGVFQSSGFEGIDRAARDFWAFIQREEGSLASIEGLRQDDGSIVLPLSFTKPAYRVEGFEHLRSQGCERAPATPAH